jgi:hypothetical protein
MVDAAEPGDRLRVRGDRRGGVVVEVDLSVAGVGDGAAISGRGRVRVLEVGEGATVKLANLSIRDGAARSGGGIHNAGELTLSRVIVKDNRAGPRNDCGLVPDPTCDYRRRDGNIGGGIVNDGTMTLERTRVRGNEAGTGGGIVNTGSLTVIDSTISRNVAALWSESGGGGILNDGRLRIARSTIAGNATVSGEGYAAGGGIFNSGRLLVTNSTISRNLAYGQNGGDAGAISNGSTYFGESGDIRLRHSTVTANVARDWHATGLGGILNCPPRACGGSGVVIVEGSIVADNGGDCAGRFNSEGHNLIGAAGCRGLEHGVAHDRVGTYRSPIDARLGPLVDDGGPTRTHRLRRGSPAVDQGGRAPCAARTDQRGVRRPQGERCDIGAVERR